MNRKRLIPSAAALALGCDPCVPCAGSLGSLTAFARLMKIYALNSEDMEARRPWTLYWVIVGECLLGGLLTAWTYTCSLDSYFSPKAFLLPAVFEISSVVGLFIGAAFSPLVYLSMRHLRLLVRAVCYFITAVAAALFELTLGSGIIGAVSVLFALCVICAFTQRSCDL